MLSAHGVNVLRFHSLVIAVDDACRVIDIAIIDQRDGRLTAISSADRSRLDRNAGKGRW